MSQEMQLLDLMNGVNLSLDSQDKRIWLGEKQRICIVKFACACLQNCNTMESFSYFDFDLFWSVKVLPNAQILVWQVITRKFPTRTNLVRRGVQLNIEICPLCLEHEKPFNTYSYLVTQYLKFGADCGKWIGVQFVYHGNLMTYFMQFHLLNLNQKQNLVWKSLWIAIIWSIWNHRNNVVFKDERVDVEEIFYMHRLKSWMWMKKKLPNFSYSFTD